MRSTKTALGKPDHRLVDDQDDQDDDQDHYLLGGSSPHSGGSSLIERDWGASLLEPTLSRLVRKYEANWRVTFWVTF
jgi:hypothetical protein